MKDMKIALKLIVSFAVVILLAVTVGIVGIIGMRQIDTAATDMYEHQMVPLPHLVDIIDNLQIVRVYAREYFVNSVVGNMKKVDSTREEIEACKAIMAEDMDAYRVTISDEEAALLFDEARTLFEVDYSNILEKCYEYAKSGNTIGIVTTLNNANDVIDTIINNFNRCMEIKLEIASHTSDNNTNRAGNMLKIIIVVLLIAVAVAIFMAIRIAALISRPVKFMKNVLLKIGTQGDLDFDHAEYRQIEEYAKCKDEVGESVGMLLAMVHHLVQVGETLKSVSEGDLTVEMSLMSEKDTLGLSLQKMIDNLNHMFGEINTATIQVNVGSKQIADGAQSLAQGSTEQTSAIERLSASIAEIADKTKENADLALRAANLAGDIKQNAETGNMQMDQMMMAVKEINEASRSISKVIGVIDSIAFQTNILALNAAVEAARAGQHGKGFAVVAEEVRSLASKSAEAAKETGSLIANSMEKAEMGARIANETATSLGDIVSGINESSKIVGDIAKSSNEQAAAITEINNGIDQVAQVVQQNSATAEQSAAASQQMSGQAGSLEGLISQFKLKGGQLPPLTEGLYEEPHGIAESSSYTNDSGLEMGKY